MKQTNWIEHCQNNTALIAYLYRTVVRDEFYPRIPDEDDIQIALQQLASNSDCCSSSHDETFFISSPDGYRL